MTKPDAAEHVEPCPLCADTKLVPGLGTECMACREEVELPQAAPSVTPSDAQPAPAPDVPELLPCPFCGSTQIAGPWSEDEFVRTVVSRIECEECAANFVFNCGSGEIGQKMCREAWNRRKQ